MTFRKFYNKPTEIDGIRFDSKKEAARYSELKLLVKLGEIQGLGMQPTFDLIVNDQRICRYKADFSYLDSGGNKVIEDVKGMKTPVYRLKKKLMKAIHGIEIQEV